MTKIQVLAQIDQMDQQLSDQVDSISGMRGMHEDIIRMMVPIQRDQLKIIRAAVELLAE
jgi:hypothetical protein